MGVGEEPRVGLHDEQPTELELLLGVVERRAPDVELGHLQPEERAQVLGRELEEGPLVALEVRAEGEGGGGQRVEAEGVEQLDPQIDVAVGLRPRPLAGVQRMGAVAGAIDLQQLGPGPRAHGQSRSRAAFGQSSGLTPCVRNRASVMRSSPKPKQHEWATAPSAVTIPNGSPKWSRWQLAEAIAVGCSIGIDRGDDLELERLRPLVLGQHPADPPEEGVVGHHLLDHEPERGEDLGAELQPAVTMLAGRVGVADVDEVVLPERLHPRRVETGLVAEAPARHVVAAPALRQRATQGRVQGMADGGAEAHIGRLEHRRPIAARLRRLHQALVRRVVSGERRHRPDQVREGGQVAGLLQDTPGHDGREPVARSRPRKRPLRSPLVRSRRRCPRRPPNGRRSRRSRSAPGHLLPRARPERLVRFDSAIVTRPCTPAASAPCCC